jgi:hypothetical protein
VPTSAEGDTMHNAQATQFCSIHDDPSWTIRDARMPFQDAPGRRRPCFLTLGIEMAASAMSEKAPATLEAGDLLQTRTAGLVV